MVRNFDGFDWWHAIDDYGPSICSRFRQTTFRLNPIEMIGKRVTTGEQINIPRLYDTLREFVEDKTASGELD